MLRRRIVDVAAVLGAMALFASTTMAATITVDDDGPADYSSISEAVEAASPGDTVLVRAGTYNEINIFLKDHMVLQGAGADSTVITYDWASARSGDIGTVVFEGVTGAKIDGFTLTSQTPGTGALIVVTNWPSFDEYSPPTITNNRLTNAYVAIWFDPFPYNPQVGFGTINGNTFTGNERVLCLALQDYGWPLPDWDFRWNWWGTTDGSQIEEMFIQDYPEPPELGHWPQVLYDPWLTGPVEDYEETPGFHFNNVYENEGVDVDGEFKIIAIWIDTGVEGMSWGAVKSQYQ